ncbi:tetratricopeptide repeat-containing sensor histidine kinase [uncultured Lacinutrix sp.]|uniref:tetratricopeptide repeat-containing sensor histidine kinase n=1 Tax=uncultured Lacinutrix sp. TaxID=574032 RepID=UPI002619368F|nr:tetratricopeptide repeat-containing sensor histidine kinase [uncultured Lacinutrix sp.]
MKKGLCLICCFIFFYSYSQKIVDNTNFNTHFKEICSNTKHNYYFHKSLSFFINKEIDSAYSNINKYFLSENRNDKLKNYAYYIQGDCAVKKKLWSEAQESLEKIPDGFVSDHFKYLNLANVFLNQKKYKEALKFYKKVEVLGVKKTDDYNQKIMYHNIGLCYLHLNDYKNAEIYLSKERNLAIKSKDTLSTIYATMDLANLYYQQYLDDKAIPLFLESYNLSKITSNLEIKQNAALNMAVVEENNKDFEKSIAYRKEYESWKDSIWNRDKIWELAKQGRVFAVKEKQKEIALQEEQIKVQKTKQRALYIGVFALALIVAIIAFFLHDRIQKNKVITQQKNKLSDLNDMKNKLFSIVSHDLRTPINTIRNNNVDLKEAFKLNNKTEISDKINQGIQVTEGVHLLLDKVLNWSLLESGQLFTNIESFPLKPILAQVIYNYKSIAASKNITIINTVSSNVIVNSDIESTKIVLRNILDNAIKYSANGSEINCKAIMNENFCNLEITDTGIGISKADLAEILIEEKATNEQSAVKGFGLRLCRSLIQNNGGDLTISSQKGIGTTVSLSIPYKSLEH